MSTEIERATVILRRALAVAASDPAGALETLERGLESFRAAGDGNAVSVLARHAGAISANAGDLQLALAYYDEALRFDQEDLHLYLASGKLRLQLSRVTEAIAFFSRALVLARKYGDDDAANVIVDLMKVL